MEYVAVLHKEENSDFGVSFPDFPGCITTGQTLDDARMMAREVLELCIAEMRAAGESIPAASSFDEVMSNPDFNDGFAFPVVVDELALTKPA